MKVAFSVAVLATVALAYSVFMNDGFCCGKKKETAAATTNVDMKTCTSGCCAKDSALALVAFQDETKTGSCCSQCTTSESKVATCCSKDMTQTVAHQDGECTSTCSEGDQCCQDKVATAATCCSKEKTQTVAHQDGECTGSCSEGGECCQDKVATGASDCTKCNGNATLVSTDDKTECTAACSKETDCKTCCSEALAKLPQMTFLVGTESVCCPEGAKALAEKNSETIKYVVATKQFDCKNEAFAALVEETETFVNAFTTPAKCDASGKTSLCGTSIGCCEAAAKQTEVVANAVKEIKIAYQVDGKKAGCVNCAKSASAQTGKPIEYVVADNTTQCELNARLMVAKAKYVAAVKAVAETSAVATEAEASKTETSVETAAK